MQAEQEACNDEEGLLHQVTGLRCNTTIKSLQFCKLVRQHNESADEWMSRFRILATECNYNDIDRLLKGAIYLQPK